MKNARPTIHTNNAENSEQGNETVSTKQPRVIGVAIASHNRKDHTLESLARLHQSAKFASCAINVFLFDDGSNDGTSAAVAERFPEVHIISGNGTNFWARSMSVTEEALRNTHKSMEYIMWLNDDVLLDRDSIIRLIESSDRNPMGIVVGATREPTSNKISYSGLRSQRIRPLMFDIVHPSDIDTPVDTFNGNCVFMPRNVAEAMGRLDGNFSHALADIEYGLRANRKNIPTILAPGTFGSCPRNASAPWRGITGEWRSFVGPKGGGNLASLTRILQKLRPKTWIIHMSASYVIWVTKTICRAHKRHRDQCAHTRIHV